MLIDGLDAFLPGLEAYKTYLKTASSDPATFSTKDLTTIIDNFAPLLFEHLADEIPTLLSLSRFETKVPLLPMMEKAGTLTALHQSITGGTPFFFRNLDLDFEGGRWKSWPPVPGLVWFGYDLFS